MSTIPAAIRPFLEFASLLRRHGFAISPDLTEDFITAIGLLGPRGIRDVYLSALAVFAIPADRRDEFDALFRGHFEGLTVAAQAETEDDDEMDTLEPTGREVEVESAEDEREAGMEATAAERLGYRVVPAGGDSQALAFLSRHAASDLPRRRSFRRSPSRKGRVVDPRATLRRAIRRDGEILQLRYARPRLRQRRIVLLIDISGSMSASTPATLSLAHALVQAAERAEAFTLGTRLTRITASLRVSNRMQALVRASSLVSDIDGGTRIGDALNAFLAVPRFAGLARGALVVVLSDGLERGEPETMVSSVARLARLAWRVDWLSPLATGPGFVPQTEALSLALPYLSAAGDGSSTRGIVSHILNIARAA